ncbi:hypothetical protein BD310DRAFT_501340 [Dichomitus squalens]|uniref:Uncharacterized protein n=1 Tax=Dichomitus squalens TaxID=114155 RepID=A0A4Q9PUE0_9APHY|nr:hypothetical protein BD310DRAFT_501340 [Dichomitus squalens]
MVAPWSSRVWRHSVSAHLRVKLCALHNFPRISAYRSQMFAKNRVAYRDAIHGLTAVPPYWKPNVPAPMSLPQISVLYRDCTDEALSHSDQTVYSCPSRKNVRDVPLQIEFLWASRRKFPSARMQAVMHGLTQWWTGRIHPPDRKRTVKSCR